MKPRLVFSEPNYVDSQFDLWTTRLTHKYPSLLADVSARFEVFLYSSAGLAAHPDFKQLESEFGVTLLHGDPSLSRRDAMVERLRDVKPHLVSNMNGRQIEAAAVDWHVARSLRAKYCYRVGGDDISTKASVIPGFLGSRRHRLISNFEFTLANRSHAIITMNEREKRRLAGLVIGPRKPARHIHVIPRGVELARYQLDRSGRQDARQFRVLFLGRESHEKGFDIAMGIAAGFRETSDGRPTKFYFCGNFERSRLDNVIKVGYTRPESVPSLFKSVDCFILPSRSEGFPNSLIEAMASGCPSIVSHHLFHDLIPDGGFVAMTKASAPDFIVALHRIADERSHADSLSTNASRYASEHFDNDKNSTTYAELLEGLLHD